MLWPWFSVSSITKILCSASVSAYRCCLASFCWSSWLEETWRAFFGRTDPGRWENFPAGLWLILVWLLLCFYELDKGTEAKLGCVCVPAATHFQIPVSVCLMQADSSETKWKQGQKLQFISNWGGNSKILSCHSRLLCQLDYKLLGFLSSISALFSVYWDGTWRAEVIIRIHSTKSSAGVHWHHTERHKFIPVEELSLIYLIYLGLWLVV